MQSADETKAGPDDAKPTTPAGRCSWSAPTVHAPTLGTTSEGFTTTAFPAASAGRAAALKPLTRPLRGHPLPLGEGIERSERSELAKWKSMKSTPSHFYAQTYPRRCNHPHTELIPVAGEGVWIRPNTAAGLG